MDNDFTICITGHTGYVGTHLVKTLIDMNHSPFLIGRCSQEIRPVPKCNCAKIWNNFSELATQINKLNNPIIINLAGLFATSHNSENFEELIQSNYIYPMKIFEMLSKIDNPRVVNIGTSWEYSDTGLKSSSNLYSELKSSNASALDWYTNNYGFRSINLKLNDTFGGDDNRKKLMPLLKDCHFKKIITELNYASQKINLLHIKDVCAGILHAAKLTLNLNIAEIQTAFLLGDETITLCNLRKEIEIIVGSKLNVQFLNEIPNNKSLRQVWENAPRLKNWKPKLSLTQGLQDYFVG